MAESQTQTASPAQPHAQAQPLTTTCCIVGGGPAGVMLGFLLARAGVDVTVLEKHADFFRDFRGDTVHPSTLELIYELGLLDQFLAQPHEEVTNFTMVIGGQPLPIAQIDRVPTHCKFVAVMPQWDFLNFIAAQAAKLPSFHLLMRHQAVGLIADDRGRILGARVQTPSGQRDIRAALTVACDGRHSAMRADAELPIRETGVPIDVLWFRLPRRPADPSNVIGNINYGTLAVLINRSDYFQCAFIIKKDSFAEVQRHGLPAFRASIARLVPFLSDRVDTLTSWDQIKLLTVQINHLTRWHLPGFLCIGDAAHAMSPVGGIGINLAIQDAVAAANILTPYLRAGFVSEMNLAHVQHRRHLPTRLTQAFQVFAHKQLSRTLGNPAPVHPPWILRFLSGSAFFRRLAARFIGVGIRPEHIDSTH
jgi:2-polyprenyl-6-methoxyphenol hydroxylase-like FAD-dependent oxidoreductase